MLEQFKGNFLIRDSHLDLWKKNKLGSIFKRRKIAQ